MLKFLQQKNKKGGFTLVEVLVALFIFTLSVTAMMAVFASGISSISATKKKMQAEYLAQEGIEVVRNIRDTYALSSNAVPNDGWTKFKEKFSTTYDCSSPCSFDSTLISEPTTSIEFGPTGGTIVDGFSRSMTITPIGADEVEVRSTISWQQGSAPKNVTFSENLYNWIE